MKPILSAFFRRDLVDEANNIFGTFLRYVFVVCNVCLFYFLYHWMRPDVQGAFSFFVTGWAFFLLTHQGLEGLVQAFQREMDLRMLEVFGSLGLSPLRLFAGLAFWPFVKAFFQMSLVLLVGEMLSPGSGRSVIDFSFWAGVFFGILIYFWVGVVIGSCLLMFKRLGGLVNLFSFANLVLAGVFYPSEILPAGIRFFSPLLPLTHLLQSVRSGFFDGGLLIWLAFLGAVSIFCLHCAYRWARKEGSLNQGTF